MSQLELKDEVWTDLQRAWQILSAVKRRLHSPQLHPPDHTRPLRIQPSDLLLIHCKLEELHSVGSKPNLWECQYGFRQTWSR